MRIPIVLVHRGPDVVPLLAGLDPAHGIVGVDVVDGGLYSFEPADVVATVSVDPAAVFADVVTTWNEAGQRIAAETGTKTHPAPHADPPASPARNYVSPRLLAQAFLSGVEGGDAFDPDTVAQFDSDVRAVQIAAALRKLGVTQAELLGAGSFGTAARLPDGRVVKVTSDPSEVQAAAVLTGKNLDHVVAFYGAWFVQGVKVSADIGWDEEKEEEIRANVRVGIVISQYVVPMARDEQWRRLNGIVRDFKVNEKLFPTQLGTKAQARKRLYEASIELEGMLRRAGGTWIKAYVDVARALAELRSEGIYAIDVHGGNVGYDQATGNWRLFDIGTSSPPETPKAATIKAVRGKATRAAHRMTIAGEGHVPEGVEVPEIAGDTGGSRSAGFKPSGAAMRVGSDGKVTRANEDVEHLGKGGGGAAEEDAKKLPRYAPRGRHFELLPEGVLSGYPAVRRTLEKHRTETPTLDTIRLSSLFAVSTVRTSIEDAERSFSCFVDLYEKKSRTELPGVDEIRDCFRGLQNTKSRMFTEVAAYAPTIQAAIASGLQDRALRRHLASTTKLPPGLAFAKLSFTLALLGHDCICLDARLLVRMFQTRERATDVEKGWEKRGGGHVSDLGIRRYEQVEDIFLEGNRHFNARDPIGRARAQWYSWESVGKKGATHSVWLDVLR